MKQLKFECVGFKREQTDILNDISFNCERGEFVGILGPNGAGKSTLLKLVAGLLLPSSGEIMKDDVAITEMTAIERARSFAYLPQQRIIHWPVAVELLVGLGRLPYQTFWKPAPQSDARIIDRAMERVDVFHMRHRMATQLSGGEQERVLLARMLAQEAEVLLADEPTSALDPAHQIGVMETFKSLSKSGHLILAALHDINLAARWCDRLIILKHGRIVADGIPREILSEQMMRTAYDVECSITQIDDIPIVMPIALAEHAEKKPTFDREVFDQVKNRKSDKPENTRT